VPPQQALFVAGVLIFDVPTTIAEPRLLLRDLAAESSTYTGTIDLTGEVTP
jgi:hypothetical protein